MAFTAASGADGISLSPDGTSFSPDGISLFGLDSKHVREEIEKAMMPIG